MDGADLLEYVKRAALGAVDAAAPCEIKLGTVTGVKPLAVRIEQRLELSESQLILPRKFSDHAVKISGGNICDYFYLSDDRDNYENVAPKHFHAIGDMEITVHGALEIGDEVILIRQRGGQKFLIFDLLAER